MIDRDMRVVLLDGAVFGVEIRGDRVGRPLAELLTADLWEVLGPHYDRAFDGERPSFEYASRDGARRWAVRMVAVGVASAPDSVTGVVALIEEITTRVRVDGLVPSLEPRHGSIIEILSEGVIVVGRAGELVQANEAARKILGHELGSGDAVWWHRLDARHSNGSPLELDSPGEGVIRSGGDLRDVRVSVRRDDGERRTLCLNYRALRDAKDLFDGLVVSFRDVTERDAENERLLSSESRLRDAQELAALTSWEWDIRRRRLTHFEGFAGRVDGHVRIGAGVEAIVDGVLPEDRKMIRRRVEELMAGTVDGHLLRYRRELDDGRLAWVETRMRAVHDEQGAAVAIRGTTQDVTRQHLAVVELEETRDFLQTTLDSLSAHVAVLDEQGCVLAVNVSWERFAGEAEQPADSTGVGSNYLEVCDAAGDDEYAQRAATALRAMLAGTRESFTMEYPCHAPDEERYFILQADLHHSAGPTRIVVQHIDITARRQMEAEALVRAHLLDEVDASVIATDAEGRITMWNDGAERLYGWTRAETVGKPMRALTAGPAEERIAREIMEAVRSSGRWEDELEVRHKNGTMIPVHLRGSVLHDTDGNMTGLVVVSVDVSQRVRNEQELRSARDYLRAVADSMAEGMCTLDLDGRVVYVNEAAGRILACTADEMMGRIFHYEAHFRRADGSPLPMEESPILEAGRHGEDVRVEDDLFVRRDGTTVPVSYTAAPFTTPDGVRGTVLIFSDISERKTREAQTQQDLEDLAWIGRINEAIEQDRLVLHAQPVADLVTGAIVQHELLIRMLDVDGSLIPPGAFLPAAERYGLIREIDRWVVRQAAALSAQGHAIELNISADSLGDANFVTMVEQELRRSGADCSLIVIELTETALLRDEDAARHFIERVKHLGCQLALDDFGTGFGGFTYLKRLDVDYLKIDIEFVRDLPRNQASQHVVRAVVGLARDFGQKTVAEGVEDADTLELLRDLGVDYAQGYHIGRPAPVGPRLALSAAG